MQKNMEDHHHQTTEPYFASRTGDLRSPTTLDGTNVRGTEPFPLSKDPRPSTPGAQMGWGVNRHLTRTRSSQRKQPKSHPPHGLGRGTQSGLEVSWISPIRLVPDLQEVRRRRKAEWHLISADRWGLSDALTLLPQGMWNQWRTGRNSSHDPSQPTQTPD